MSKPALLLLAFLPLRLWASLELTLSPQQCQPGDMVELRVQGDFESYASFELNIPNREEWFLVAHEQGPVRYTEGRYYQEAVVVFQPLRAGLLDLGAVEAIVRRGGEAKNQDLTIPLLTVSPYATEEDSDDPSLLPPINRQTGTTKPYFWLSGIVLAAGVLSVLLIWVRSRKGARP